MKKYFLFAFIILVVVGGAVAYYQYNKPVASIENKKPDVTLTANELLSAFEENEAAANQQYGEKIVQVRGRVSEVVSVEAGHKIFIETENPMSGVICEMEEGQEVSTIKPGDEVTIKGRCTGFLSDVVLVQASLVK